METQVHGDPGAATWSLPIKRVAKGVAGGLVVLALVGLMILHLSGDREVPPVPSLPANPKPVIPAVPTPEEVFRRDITPLLEAFENRNRTAAGRAIQTLRARISAHRAGIAPFCEEITGWGTRFGVAGRAISDLWHNLTGNEPDRDSVKPYVEEIFKRWILSEDALRMDLRAALTQLNEDLQASRNILYVDLRLPLSKIKTATVASDAGFARFISRTQELASGMVKDQASDSVLAGLATVAVGFEAMAGAEALSTYLVTQIMTRIGTQIAIEGLEVGGATLAGASAGAGGGSIAGPVGTGVGLVAGFVAGWVVDEWMCDQFTEKLTGQLNTFLDELAERLVRGDGKSTGLDRMFRDTVTLAGKAQREALLRAAKAVVQ